MLGCCWFYYIDELLISTKNREGSYERLEILLNQLKEHVLYKSLKNSTFFQDELAIIGFIAGKDGICVKTDRIRFLQTFLKLIFWRIWEVSVV